MYATGPRFEYRTLALGIDFRTSNDCPDAAAINSSRPPVNCALLTLMVPDFAARAKRLSSR